MFFPNPYDFPFSVRQKNKLFWEWSQLLVHIMEVNGHQNGLVTICVLLKKESPMDLERGEGE